MKKLLLLILFTFQCSFIFSQNFYDQNTIQEIRLTFTDPNWNAILVNAKINDLGYVPAQSVSINGTVFQNVGVKYKGNSSFRNTFAKNPFHIELDTYQNQDYNGIKDIKLSNVFYDPSFVREVVSYDIINKYMHAPKANYTTVYVNNVLIGLYVNTEAITKKFVKDHFGSNNNPFFEAEIAGGATPNSTNKPNLTYRGPDPVGYQGAYEIKSTTGWDDLINLIDILNNNTSQIETVLDVDRALWMLAFNNIMVNLDSYTGLINHNYYLYKDGTGRFSPIVWDLNMSFGTFDLLEYSTVRLASLSEKAQLDPNAHENNDNWPLIKNLLANPKYKKMYLAHMHTILDENFSNDYYITKSNALRTLIDTSVQNDTNKFYPYAEFQNGMTTSTLVHDNFTANGISELMSLRKTFLQNNSSLSAMKPVISNIIPSQASPLINTNISFKATVINTNNDAVFFGHRSNLNDKFVKVQMFDDGAHNDDAAGDNIYGTSSILLSNVTMQYYIYAENNAIGAFSPARAEHEFHSINATNSINPDEIKINELMAQNTTTISDAAGEFEDWIELYNNTGNTISLDGLFLTDNATNLQKWQFPNGISIPANGYLMIWADSDLTQTDGIHADFKLSASGESIILSKVDGTIIDSVTFGMQTPNISYARIPNGTGNFVLKNPTYSQNNEAVLSTGEVKNNDKMIFVYPNPSNSLINFVMENDIINRIEIYNMVGQKVDDKETNSSKITLNIEHLQKGTYLAKIHTNNQYKTVKFIKN